MAACPDFINWDAWDGNSFRLTQLTVANGGGSSNRFGGPLHSNQLIYLTCKELAPYLAIMTQYSIQHQRRVVIISAHQRRQDSCCLTISSEDGNGASQRCILLLRRLRPKIAAAPHRSCPPSTPQLPRCSTPQLPALHTAAAPSLQSMTQRLPPLCGKPRSRGGTCRGALCVQFGSTIKGERSEHRHRGLVSAPLLQRAGVRLMCETPPNMGSWWDPASLSAVSKAFGLEYLLRVLRVVLPSYTTVVYYRRTRATP
jgi:hypothetical protein